MKKLEHKIFFFFVGLLLVVQSIVLFSNYQTMEQQKLQQIESRLLLAETDFKNQFDSRSYYLTAFAETAAKDFGLKQVFEEDTRSFLVALNNHRKRIKADIAVAVNTEGKVVGQLVNTLVDDKVYKIHVGSEQNQPFQYMDRLERNEISKLYLLDEVVYQLSFSPLKSGDLTIGWVGFGYSIDQRLAYRFTDLTKLSTAFALKSESDLHLLASSQNHSSQQAVSKEILRLARIIDGDIPSDVIATIYSLGSVNDQQLFAVMYGFRSDLLGALQERWKELALLTVLVLILSFTGAYWIAASISRPVKVLVDQAKDIASGNYNHSINYAGKDELGQLAQEFNQMKQAVVNRERTISQQAFHDSLTGLPNRYRLSSTIEQLTMSERRPFALVRIGPQRINDVNYSLGHRVGDKVILELAKRLLALAETNLLFNVGGTGFALLIKNANEENLKRFFDQLDQAMDAVFELDDFSLHVQVQAGVALYPDHDSSGEQLLEMAGMALQHAQQTSLPLDIYDASLSRNKVEQLQLANGLKSAIEENQLELFYQPKLNISSATITEVEALVRWQHPEHGLIPPDKFIGLAEQTGHIHQLTRWVLDTSLRQYRSWLEQDIQLSIAVNVSAESFKNPDFYQEVIGSLERYALSPEAICLEVTESVVVDDPNSAIELLSRFQKKGFRMSIDDYGTGYSSLEQLKQLPVADVKIDKAFVMTLLQHDEDQVIVKSTIEMVHAMGLGVIAEGVEDQLSLEWLQRHKCDMAQGYFICRPKPSAEFTDWLRQSPYFKPLYDLKKAE